MRPTINQIKVADQNYPILLRNIPESPPDLYYLGDLPKNDEKLIAIVGTRKATRDGLLIAKQIANGLAKNNITIVSGLALGIDGAVHEGTLAANGKTIAVLANGLDTIYPRSHEKLAQDILSCGGAIISEYPADTPAYPSQFLARNRIISGLSLATIIIEAPIHSGALVTARYAIEQGREVLVMPGPTTSKNYAGSHLLVRNGARLVTSVNDILEDLNLDTNDKDNDINEDIDDSTKIILDTLKNSKKSLSLDNIVEITKLEPHIINQRLTFLIIDKIISEKTGKFAINENKL